MGGKQVDPCTLVRKSEAQSVVGGAVAASIEAPLGPTCIYQLAGSKTNIMVSVQSSAISQLKHQMKKPATVTIDKRIGYCGKLGTETLLVPLMGGRILTVSAPCAVAQRLAAIALTRLSA